MPSCTQCEFSHVACPGYSLDWEFRPVEVSTVCSTKKPVTARSRKSKKAGQSIELQKLAQAVVDRLTPDRALKWPVCSIVSLCIQNLTPTRDMFLETASAAQMMCSWVTVLSELVDRNQEYDDLLPSSIRALGESIIARGANGLAPVSSALEVQSSAMRAMSRAVNRALSCNGRPLCDEFAAAIMCLIISEVSSHAT